MKKITIENVTLNPIEGTRGSKLIYIDGAHWATADAEPKGVHGLMHSLRYPSGCNLKDKQANGALFNARVRSKKMRQRHDNDVDDQETAIKKRIVDLHNRDLIESPTVRADRLKTEQEESQRAQAERDRQETWAREGLISLARIPGISDKEAFALKYAFKDIFHEDMP